MLPPLVACARSITDADNNQQQRLFDPPSHPRLSASLCLSARVDDIHDRHLLHPVVGSSYAIIVFWRSRSLSRSGRWRYANCRTGDTPLNIAD
ncbi:hypothetical protein FRC08_000969 [Ceratobasidium sp. 394]|nr:hypothetical protein FRC08_000969 [Ceratobasidium sp. 394]